MRVHQSDLSSMTRCGEQHRRQLNGEQGKQLSATAFGSVMHQALHVLERHRDVELAVQTFEYYWHPQHIEMLHVAPVEEWIMRQSYSNLLAKGRATIRAYWEAKRYDDEEILALEIPFVVPIGEHELAGTIDRLALRHYRGRLTVCVDDYKSGRKPLYLPYHVQFSAYTYATTQPEFWTGNPGLTDGFGPERGADLFKRLTKAPRMGWWININGGPEWISAGVRGERDYVRLRYSVDMYARAREAGVYQLNVSGDTCRWCPFRDDCPPGLSSIK